MNKKSFWKGFLTGIVLMGLGLFFAMKMLMVQPDVSLNEMKLEDLSGKQISMVEMLGKPLVINYWATWCSPCLQEFPEFEKVKKQWESKVTFLMVSDETSQKIQTFKEKMPYSFNYLRGIKGFEKINVRPTTFIYNKNGELISKHTGSISEGALNEILNKIK